MQGDQLLRDVVHDLESLLEDAEEYSVLRASGLLRLMLLDRDPLLVQVAKAHGVRLSFAVARTRLPEGKAFGNGITASYPNLVPSRGGLSTDLDLGAFLTHPAVRVTLDADEVEFSVRTVIRVAAIAFGGIHFMDPDRAEDRHLAVLARCLDPASGRGITIAVQSVGHVVAQSCSSLMQRLGASSR